MLVNRLEVCTDLLGKLSEESLVVAQAVLQKMCDDPAWGNPIKAFVLEGHSASVAVSVGRPSTIPVWMTMSLPMYRNEHAYTEARRKQSCSVGNAAGQILAKLVCVTKPVNMHVHRATLEQLGLPDGGTFAEVMSAVLLAGGKFCTIELVLALRLQYVDQPRDEDLIAVMDPVEVNGNRRSVLVVKRKGYARWVVSEDIVPDLRYGPKTEVIFSSEAPNVAS